jgi:hypothetical protein
VSKKKEEKRRKKKDLKDERAVSVGYKISRDSRRSMVRVRLTVTSKPIAKSRQPNGPAASGF